MNASPVLPALSPVVQQLNKKRQRIKAVETAVSFAATDGNIQHSPTALLLPLQARYPENSMGGMQRQHGTLSLICLLGFRSDGSQGEQALRLLEEVCDEVFLAFSGWRHPLAGSGFSLRQSRLTAYVKKNNTLWWQTEFSAAHWIRETGTHVSTRKEGA